MTLLCFCCHDNVFRCIENLTEKNVIVVVVVAKVVAGEVVEVKMVVIVAEVAEVIEVVAEMVTEMMVVEKETSYLWLELRRCLLKP